MEAQMARAPWFELWLAGCLYGWILILSWWCAVSYCWMLGVMAGQAPDRAEWCFNVGVIGFISGVFAAGLAWGGGVNALGAAITLIALPVVHFTLPLAEMPIPRPVYDRAIAQLNFGKTSAAEKEIIAQLEKVENDFKGWMMLAEVYAQNFKNMEDAAQVVLDLCNDPATKPFEISIACDKLADWQLEIAGNAEAARAALELLCRKLPGTHFARMAGQRLKQMPRSSRELLESRQPQKIRLPSLAEQAAAPAASAKPFTRAEATREANDLAERLSEDPNDAGTREKLAVVLAEKLGRVELGIEQLQLLMEMPETEDAQRSKWMAQIASWRFSLDKDPEKFRLALQELIRSFPQSAQAFAAQRKLFLLETGALIPS
jgi:hypothetical protein